MKLTETQKNFRKIMQNQKPETDPYDYHRNRRQHLGGFKAGSKGASLMATLIIVAVVGVIYYGFFKSPAPVASINGQPVTMNSATAYSSAVPAAQARYIQQMGSSLQNVNNAMKQVAQFHTQGTSTTDSIGYRNSLLSGMKVCTEEKQRLMQTNTPVAFAPMKEAAIACTSYTEQALVNWHDSAVQPSNSSVERGNYYNNLANQSWAQYRMALENFLKNNHYKYTKTNNEITYWYQQ